MEKDWVLIYTTNQEYQAEILKQHFADNGMEVFVINKKDSFYVVLGDIEFYVLKENEEAARLIIKNFES